MAAPKFPRAPSKRPSSIRQRFKRAHEFAGVGATSTTAATSARMGRIGQRDTAPELAVRRILRTLGLRYTTRNAGLPGSPDIANRTQRFAIFVHGCFWHRHAHCVRATTPKRNSAFWLAKFARNQTRDLEALRALRTSHFTTLTIWECELSDVQRVAERISRHLKPRGVVQRRTRSADAGKNVSCHAGA